MKPTLAAVGTNLSPAGKIVSAAVLALSLLASPLAFADRAYGEGCEAALAEDYETAYEKWEPLISRNDGRAQFQLALMYHAGLHVEQDESKAVMLYHMAARNGVPEAQEFLVAAYAHGWFGLPKNEQVADYWQQQTALSG